MIDLDPKQLEEVKAILQANAPHCEVRVFGSRVRGTAKPYSDLDLVLVGEEALGWQTIEALKDTFSQSNLPISVDIVDWHDISEDFQKIINECYEILQAPNT